MKYKLVYAPEVVQMFRSLPPEDQQAVRVLFDWIAQSPATGDHVQSMPGARYQKTYYADKQRWPDGIRAIYTVFESVMTVAILNLGDHNTCATHPGQSIYPDER